MIDFRADSFLNSEVEVYQGIHIDTPSYMSIATRHFFASPSFGSRHVTKTTNVQTASGVKPNLVSS